MTQRTFSSSSSPINKFDVFNFDDEEENIEKVSEKMIEKFKNPNNPTSPPISKYQFLEACKSPTPLPFSSISIRCLWFFVCSSILRSCAWFTIWTSIKALPCWANWSRWWLRFVICNVYMYMYHSCKHFSTFANLQIWFTLIALNFCAI